MTDDLYAEMRATRKRIAVVIASVEPHERAELWQVIDALDAWLDRFARYEIVAVKA